MPYVETRGFGRLYYEADGAGPAVLLVPGAAQDTLSWRFVIPALSGAGYRAYAVDLPGHGKSQLPAAGPVDDLGAYGECLVEIMAELGLAEAAVVGHSMAAGIALHAALRAPDRVRLIVSVDGAGFTNRTYNDEFFDLVTVNATDWFEVNFRTICSPRTSVERVEEIAFDVHRCATEVAWNDIAAYARLDLRDRLPSVTTPVFFLHGADDWSITPEMARQTRALCTQARTGLRVLDGTGHFPHVEAPDVFNPALLDVLGDQWCR